MNNIYIDIETIPNQSPEYRAEVRQNITAPAKFTIHCDWGRRNARITDRRFTRQ